MFAIGCRPLWSYKRSPLMKGCYRTQATDLSGCKQFIEFGDPEGLLATSLDTVQRIINAAMARSRRTIESKDPSSPPTFIPPPPFNRRFYFFSPLYRKTIRRVLASVNRGTCEQPRVLRAGKPRGRSATWLPESKSNQDTHIHTYIYNHTYIYIYIHSRWKRYSEVVKSRRSKWIKFATCINTQMISLGCWRL